MSQSCNPPSPCEAEQQLATVCYLSIDGMSDPLGRSQVLPYLTGLACLGHRITLLSLEKPDRFARDGARIKEICEASGIEWVPLPYCRKPPILAGMWNSYRLGRRAAKLHRLRHFDLVHARSDLASLAARRLWASGGVHLLYDMRALWPDERVEGGAWPQSNLLFRAIYRKFKRHQAEFIRRADAIVCLTSAAKALVEQWPGRAKDVPVIVIPCAADFDHFSLPLPDNRATARRELGIGANDRVVTYLGSIGSWYMLNEMLDFFATYRKWHPSARFLIVTPDEPAAILSAAKDRAIGEAVIIRCASREQVPSMLAASDLGIFFIQPVASKRVSCPTKLGEMLATGIPVVANSGVGDVAEILKATGGGIAIDHFGPAAYDAVIAQLHALRHEPEAVRDKARAWFDVDLGIKAYDSIYLQLVKKGPRH